MQTGQTQQEKTTTNNKSKFRWWIIPVIAGSVGVGAILGGGAVAWSDSETNFTQSSENREATLHQLNIFADVLARVNTDYVVQPKQDELIDSAINGMLSSLDPHSSFMNAKEFNNMQTSTRGEYGGLGLEVTSDAGSVKVISPMDGSPGQKAGIKAGDRIIAIDGKNIVGMPLDDAVEQMRGKPGTSIDLTISREGTEGPIVLKLKREIIVLHAVTSRVEGDIGYIRISTFVNENTSKEVDKAIDDIQRKLGGNVKGIILDLRNNGGGLLDQAVEVSDIFMDRGEIVSTRGRRPEQIERYYGNAGEKMAGVPLVILTNEGTASASEIVAGALQDRKRAVIFGTTSFGKGSVQTVIPLSGGKDGALRLTTAKYYTPSGRSIQGAGIKPDIEVSGIRLTDKDIERRKAEFRFEEDLPNALNNDSGAKREQPHMPKDMPPENWNKDKDYVLDRAIAFIHAGMPKGGLVQTADAQKPAAKKPETGKQVPTPVKVPMK